MISPITQAQMNNGWLVCLQSIIVDFNAWAVTLEPMQPLSNGQLNGGERSCVGIIFAEMNDRLINNLGADAIEPLTNWQINSGFKNYMNYLVDNVNTSISTIVGGETSPYTLFNATYTENMLVYTGGLFTPAPVAGDYLEYHLPPDNTIFEFAVPDLIGTSVQINTFISSIPAESAFTSTYDNTVGATITLEAGSSLLSEKHIVETPVAVSTGDVISVKRVGNTIEIKLNGTLFAVTDAITDGSPDYMYIMLVQLDTEALVLPSVNLTIT